MVRFSNFYQLEGGLFTFGQKLLFRHFPSGSMKKNVLKLKKSKEILCEMLSKSAVITTNIIYCNYVLRNKSIQKSHSNM